MRPRVLALCAFVLALAGVAAAWQFFSTTDDATVTRSDGPGAVRARHAEPVVAAGNVVLLHRESGPAAGLHALADAIAGPPNPALEAAGQAILVRRDPTLGVPIAALTSSRRIDVQRASDPQLRRFVEYWLGRRAVNR